MAIYLEFSQPHLERIRFRDRTKASPFMRIVGRGPDRCQSEGDGEAGWITVTGDKGTWEVSWRERDDDRLIVTDVLDYQPQRVPVQVIMMAKSDPARAQFLP